MDLIRLCSATAEHNDCENSMSLGTCQKICSDRIRVETDNGPSRFAIREYKFVIAQFFVPTLDVLLVEEPKNSSSPCGNQSSLGASISKPCLSRFAACVGKRDKERLLTTCMRSIAHSNLRNTTDNKCHFPDASSGGDLPLPPQSI